MFRDASSKVGRRGVDERFSLVYEELRKIASSLLHKEPYATIRSAALVDEAWVKLRNSPQLADTTPTHFKAITARVMRQVLVEEARRRNADKRGGVGKTIFLTTLSASAQPEQAIDVELLDLEAALDELARMSERQAEIVANVFYG